MIDGFMHHLARSSSGSTRSTITADSSFVKQVGFCRLLLRHRVPAQMGLVQSLAVPGPLMAAKVAPFVPAPCACTFLRKRILVLAGLSKICPTPRTA